MNKMQRQICSQFEKANRRGIIEAQKIVPQPAVFALEVNNKSTTYYESEGVCGFGGVVIEPHQMKIVNALRKGNVKIRKHYYGGWYIPAPSKILGQSFARQKRWAIVVANKLSKNRINCRVYTQLD